MTGERIPRQPSGAVDWVWFHRERSERVRRRERGLCVNCGQRPAEHGLVVCRDSRCVGKPYHEPGRCSFCGRRFPLSGAGTGGSGSPLYPCWISRCADCSRTGRARIPDTDELTAQMTLL